MINQQIEMNFASYLKDLQDLVKHRSVYESHESFAFGEGVYDALNQAIQICKRMGFKTYLDSKGRYAYAEIGQGEDLFGVLGHMDVVPEGDRSLWVEDPYTLRNDGTYLYARGVGDDKGPMLSALYALKLALDEGLVLTKRVRFIFGGDEESLWRCMDAYCEAEEIPSQGFTPDATFPLIYAEKGLIQFNLYDDSNAKILFEGGNAYNAIPDTCVIDNKEAYLEVIHKDNIPYEIAGDKIIIKGKSVHAMAADQGINANVLAAYVLKKTENINPLVSFAHYKGAQPNGELIFGAVEDDMSGKLMFNLAIVKGNMVGIDIRFPVTVDKQFIIDKMNQVASDYGLRVEEYDYLRAIHMDPKSNYIQTLMAIYQEETGDMDSKPIASGGATYARAMDNIVAFGPGFKGHEQYEHQANERVLIEDVKRSIRIYNKAFKKLVF